MIKLLLLTLKIFSLKIRISNSLLVKIEEIYIYISGQQINIERALTLLSKAYLPPIHIHEKREKTVFFFNIISSFTCERIY